eukprot:1537073-Amphidinium_carterae.1
MLESPPTVIDPDPVGILSRPYRLRNWGRGDFVHPSLVEGHVLYAHESGCYPRSVVPRFVDIGVNNPVALERRRSQERQFFLELRSTIPRLVEAGEDDHEALTIRRKQERQALMEMAPRLNPYIYPWIERVTITADVLGAHGPEATPEDDNLFYWVSPFSKDRREVERYRATNQFRYEGSSRPPGARTWCYVCQVGHPRNPTRTNPELAKCAFCIDVYMCFDHCIYLACMGPGSTTTICCRHSRFTPGLWSWNPVGGYP